MAILYKICRGTEWEAAKAAGTYAGSADDLRDGFIHLSTGGQVRHTAQRHFAGQRDLVLVALDEKRFGPALRYEPGRDGALFPHLYGRLDPVMALWVKPLPIAPTGEHVFPELA